MMPAPMTPADVIVRGWHAVAHARSFLLRSVRKNTLSSARLTGEPNSLAKSSASSWQAASTSRPAAPSITSSAASGAG